MDQRPGEMKFINNYHMLHGRTAYEDDPANHYDDTSKRLRLATHALTERPERFQSRTIGRSGSRSVHC